VWEVAEEVAVDPVAYMAAAVWVDGGVPGGVARLSLGDAERKDGPPFKGDKRGAQRRVRGITVGNPYHDPVPTV